MAGTRERYRLALCEQVLGKLCSGKERNRILQTMLELACKELAAQAGSIILLSAGRKKGKFVAVVSKRPQALRRISLSMGRGIVGWCVRNKRMAWVPDVSRDGRYDPEISEKIKFPTRNILCAPIKRGKAVVGAVELINCKGKRLSASRLEQFRGAVDAVSSLINAGK